VVSGSAPVLHYQLAIASPQEKVTVTASPEDLNPDSPRRDILISQQQISRYAGVTPPTVSRSSPSLFPAPTWRTTNCTSAAGIKSRGRLTAFRFPTPTLLPMSDHSSILKTSRTFRLRLAATPPNTVIAFMACSTSRRIPALSAIAKPSSLP